MNKLLVFADIVFLIVTSIMLYYFLTMHAEGLAVFEKLGRMVVTFIALCVEILILIILLIMRHIKRKQNKEE